MRTDASFSTVSPTKRPRVEAWLKGAVNRVIKAALEMIL
jgi:hypothetical protein